MANYMLLHDLDNKLFCIAQVQEEDDKIFCRTELHAINSKESEGVEISFIGRGVLIFNKARLESSKAGIVNLVAELLNKLLQLEDLEDEEEA